MRKNYNFTRRKLSLPEYGRHIHQMVDSLLMIEDRAERTRQAKAVIAVMGNINPMLRDTEEFKHKLWDHLAVMSDFKLDIDYPYEVVKPEDMHAIPQRIPYPKGAIRYRHYGRCIEEMMKKVCTMPEGEERSELLRLIAAQMKKEYVLWNKDNVEDSKIIEDIIEYSSGQICLSENELNLGVYRAPAQQNNNNKNKGKNQRRKNKKKY